MDSLKLQTDGTDKEVLALGGTAAFTRKHYINDRSIEWKYSEGDALEIRGQIIVRKREAVQTSHLCGKTQICYEYPFGISCRIYSEAVSGGRLRFSFGRDGKETQSFVYLLNFKGWKEISIPYERGYMTGKYSEKMNYFRITAIDGGGAIYLDDIQLCKPVCPNHVYLKMAEQVENMPLPTRRGAQAKRELHSVGLLRPTFFLEPCVTEEESRAFCEIEKKYLELIDEVDLPPFQRGNMDYEQAIEFYRSYEISDCDGVITGKYITAAGPYARALKSVAAHFVLSGEKRDADIFVDMFRHLMDQNTQINWYYGRGVGSALLLMREELAARGMLDEATAYLKQAYCFSRIYKTSGNGLCTNASFEDTDDIGMDLPSTLACILLMENSPEKVRDMRHLTYYIENFCLGYAPGTVSGYKPDGTAFHHCGYVRNYGAVANYSLARVIYMLANTAFMISEEAVERFKYILRTEFIIYNGVYEPFAMAQYMFDAMRDTSVVEFAHMANALNDSEFARMYVTLAECSEKEQKNPNYQKFLQQGAEPIREISEHKTLTYSAAAFHKRNDKTMAVRGHSKYVYPMEVWPYSYGRYTAFSLFRSFGFLEILNTPGFEGGTNNGLHIDKGFDYCRWPGSTAVHVPIARIKSTPLIVEDEWSEWLLSDRAFVGGLDSADKNGVFAMQLHGPEKYGLESFFATKTYHFFDDIAVCLGSNISSGLKAYATETTLFQDYGTGAERRGNTLVDNRGNGYRVFPEYEVEFYTEQCRSRNMTDTEDTCGERTFGIIPHGKAPQNAKYAYVVKLGTTMEEMENTDFERDIQILQQDEVAHIVKLYNKTNYVFFRKCYEMDDGFIDNVSGSCIVSVTKGDGRLSIAVCDPDLRFYLGESEDYDLNRRKRERSIYGRIWVQQESIPSRIWLTVNAEVSQEEIKNDKVRVIQTGGGKSTLEFFCKDGMTTEISINTIK